MDGFAELHSGSRISNQQSILILGSADSIESARRVLERSTDLDARIISSVEVDDGIASLALDENIVLVLLLWAGDTQDLVDTARTLLEQKRKYKLSVMVRSQNFIPQDTCDTLWEIGIEDRSYYQPVESTEFLDSMATVIRNCRRHQTLESVSSISKRLSSAKTLHDLAHLSLLSTQELQLPILGGIFCYIGNSTKHHPRLIAGAGCYNNFNCIPLEHLSDALAKSVIQTALDQACDQVTENAAAIYIHTQYGYTACLYFSIEKYLQPWELQILKKVSDMIATSIDQSQLMRKMKRIQHDTINSLSRVSEFRDTDTGDHVERVAKLTTEIAQMLSRENEDIDETFLEHIGLASILHDTGKVAIPDSILLKQGPLDPHERLAMEQHVILGYDLLNGAALRTDDMGLLTRSAEVARYHHERFDGSGYPEKLKGDAIPLSARIVALVDVYDALTCERPYKLPWPHEKAIEFIRDQSGLHFDPIVVDAFLQLDTIKRETRYIEWNDKMSVKHHDLDSDHRLLIDIINRLWVAINIGNRQIIEFVLDDLVNYTLRHFSREEKLMKQVGYQDLERHCRIHQGICSRLEEIRWEYFEGIRDDLRIELLEFVSNWLNKHILEEDMQYSSNFQVAA